MRLVFALLVVGLCGCPARTEVAKTQSAFSRTKKEIRDGVGRAYVATEDVDQYKTVVRYNPARCACPPFEIFAYGRWVRVIFDGDERAMNGLAEYQTREKRTPSLSTYTVRGRFASKMTPGENNVLYRTFLLGDRE